METAERNGKPRPDRFALIPVFRLKPEWRNASSSFRDMAADEAVRILQNETPGAAANIYITQGLNASADYFLRVRAYDLLDAQNYVKKWMGTKLGRGSELIDMMIGVSKPRHYITPERSPHLDSQLNRTSYEGGRPGFVIVIPIKKSPKWWAMPESARLSEMERHTHQSISYLPSVHRELYHCTGLDEADFITYFETNDLMGFHELVVALARIPEYEFQIPSGHNLLLGTIHSIPEAVQVLCDQDAAQQERTAAPV